MLKYIRINLILFKNSYIRDSKIPGYVFSVLSFHIIEMIMMVTFLQIIFKSTALLSGWSFYQVLFLYAFGETVVRIHAAWTKKGVRAMAGEYIRQGEFDFYLTKPVDTMFLVSISKPRILDFLTVLFQVGLGTYAILAGGMQIGILNAIWFIFLFFIALVLYYHLQIITLIPVFWIIRTYALQFFMNRVGQFMKYPIGILPQILKVILMVVFPILAIAYIPTTTLFSPPRVEYIGYMITITFIFAVVTKLLWNLGVKNYSSASS